MTGGDPESSYEYWLNETIYREFPSSRFVIDNQGICGQTSAGILFRLRQLVQQSNLFDHIIFWGGANDLALGYNPEKIWKNLQSAVSLANEVAIPMILVNIPPMNFYAIRSYVLALNQKIRNESGIQYRCADVYSRLVCDDDLCYQYDAGDGVH